MKIRQGFVSNSSSSSYLIAGVKWQGSEKELRHLIVSRIDELYLYIKKYQDFTEERFRDLKRLIKDQVYLDENHKNYDWFCEDYFELIERPIYHNYYDYWQKDLIKVGRCSVTFDDGNKEKMDIKSFNLFINDAKNILTILGLDSTQINVYHYTVRD